MSSEEWFNHEWTRTHTNKNRGALGAVVGGKSSCVHSTLAKNGQVLDLRIRRCAWHGPCPLFGREKRKIPNFGHQAGDDQPDGPAASVARRGNSLPTGSQRK